MYYVRVNAPKPPKGCRFCGGGNGSAAAAEALKNRAGAHETVSEGISELLTPNNARGGVGGVLQLHSFAKSLGLSPHT